MRPSETGPDAMLVFAAALAAGVLGHVVARHARMPAIVPLLGLGVLLGPDALGWVHPAALGTGLYVLVELGVAVILFDGALHLEGARLRRESLPIQRLVTVGAAITFAGGALAARLALGWPWPIALLFGALVIVTGPTVIGPLLRNVRVRQRPATVLEAEGVLIDPIGAIVAAIVLQAVLIGATAEQAAWLGGGLLGRLAFGAAAGIAGGFALAGLLRSRLVPDGLENLVALGGALALFAACEALLSQMGILAVTVAGIVVGNAHTRIGHELRAFQGNLTLVLIGLLFVLLAADVRLREVVALGAPGLAVVAALVVAVRPLNVLASTWGSELDGRDRAFLAWIAPRGIVAAGVSSLFAVALDAAGIAGGTELRALVFLTIAVTVVVQGLTASAVARALGVGLPDRDGVAILGADPLALELARTLADGGRRVVVIDANPAHCRAAEEQGIPAVYGNALEARTLARARLELASEAVGMTSNEEANLLFAREARQLFGVPARYVALGARAQRVGDELLEREVVSPLFDGVRDLERWSMRLRHGEVIGERWRFTAAPAPGTPAEPRSPSDPWLVLAVARAGTWRPMSADFALRPGDRARVLLHAADAERARERLRALGWNREAAPDEAEALGEMPADVVAAPVLPAERREPAG